MSAVQRVLHLRRRRPTSVPSATSAGSAAWIETSVRRSADDGRSRCACDAAYPRREIWLPVLPRL